MPEVTSTAIIPADVDTVWRAIRDFDGLPSWVPAIEASELEGELRGDQVGVVRRLTLGDGGTVRERLVALDDRERRLTYAILESPFPVQDYRSTVRVFPVTTTGESFVVWSVVFDCDLADTEQLCTLFGRDVYDAGLKGLVSHLSPGA